MTRRTWGKSPPETRATLARVTLVHPYQACKSVHSCCSKSTNQVPISADPFLPSSPFSSSPLLLLSFFLSSLCLSKKGGLNTIVNLSLSVIFFLQGFRTGPHALAILLHARLPTRHGGTHASCGSPCTSRGGTPSLHNI